MSQSTAMVMSGWPVHLTTLFSWASLTKQLTSTLCHTLLVHYQYMRKYWTGPVSNSRPLDLQSDTYMQSDNQLGNLAWLVLISVIPIFRMLKKMLHVVMFMTRTTKGQKIKQYESNTSRHNKCFLEKKLSYLKIQIHDLTAQ